MAKLEVLPVPAEFVPRFWRGVKSVGFSRIPGYNIERTHMRLLAGVDQLWIACNSLNHVRGVIVTSISPRPPQDWKVYRRKDPAAMKSLTIHIAGEYNVLSWLDSAIERIQLYARQHNCRMLFILTRKGWHMHMHGWYSKEWEAVAIGRDRSTVSKCHRLIGRNTPGYFRLMVPIPAERWDRYHYAIMSEYRFKEAA